MKSNISNVLKGMATLLMVIVATTSIAQNKFVVPEEFKQLLDIGLESNYQLKIIHGEEQQAINSAQRSNSGYLPTASLSGGYDISADNVNSKISGDAGTYRSRYYDQDQSVDVGVGFSWMVFNGFSIRTTYERYKELASQSQTETRIAIEDYIASLAAEYYNYIQQHNRLRNLNNAVELSRERLRIVRARYMVGSFSRLDYQQASVDFNVDSADYIIQREVLKRSAITLNELMSAKNSNAEVAIRDTVISLDSSLKYEELLGDLERNNLELRYAMQSTSISELDYKKVLSRNYPYVQLTGGYGYEHYLYNVGTTLNSGRLGADAGVTVGFTIFDSTRRTDRKNAAIAKSNAKLNQQDVELKLIAQLNDLWQAYINNLGLLNLEISSLDAAKQNYEIAMERYMLGNLSGIEMREAQKSLLDAEDRILSATYNTKICEISLLQISGNITNYLGD